MMTPERAGRLAYELAKKSKDMDDSAATTTSRSSMNTLLAHAGLLSGDASSSKNAPMSPPLHLATTYTRPPDGPYGEGDSIYTRMDNPTRLLLEETVAKLECHGEERERSSSSPAVCCAFASGMSAVSSIVLSHGAPVTILLPKDLYHGVPTVLVDVLERFQVSYRQVDLTETSSSLERALATIPPPSQDVIVWMETPSNPLCHVIDMQAICNAVQNIPSNTHKITTVVDATLSTPCLTQPLRLGADLVLHSATKYLGGHSDVLAGVVTASPWTERGRELGGLLRKVQVAVGAVASPLDSWLTLRGLRSLHVRVERQCRNALRLAQHLSSKQQQRQQQHSVVVVKAVHYPGLESHPGHAVAKRQMRSGFGGVLSVEFESEAMAMAVAGALSVVQRATSLGGTETLVEHRNSIEPSGRKTSPPGLLRISVGLEDAEDLLRDFDRAIFIANQVVHEE